MRSGRWRWWCLAVAVLLPTSAIALASAFPASLRIPPRVAVRAEDPKRALPQALFSHRSHQSFGCYACHPSTFPQAPVGFTHVEMRERKFCGRCHDGSVAWAIEGATCQGCHAPTN